MQYERLIIDGYNLLHQVESLSQMIDSDIQGARHRLVRMVEETARGMAQHTVIVFDGRKAGGDAALTSRHVEVLFSPANLSADTVIERLVCRLSDPGRSLVVTSDRAERDTVSSAGAQTMSVAEFVEKCDANARREIPRRTPPGKEPRLGDLFPDGL